MRAAAIMATIVALGGSAAQAAQITLDSRSSVGTVGNRSSYPRREALSHSGRFVVFYSEASNLVPGDTNQEQDVFVRDRLEETTERVSVSSLGIQGETPKTFPLPPLSNDPAISGNGRFVAFTSTASNLVPGDTNDAIDVFLHDRDAHETSRVSLSSSGMQGHNGSSEPSISEDGRFVAFGSSAGNLVSSDTNHVRDVFVRDTQTQETTRISMKQNGEQARAASWESAISANGEAISFVTWSRITPSDDKGRDVFVHDRVTGQNTWVSQSQTGERVVRKCFDSDISGDGRRVVFWSVGANFVAGDDNLEADVFLRDLSRGRTRRLSIGLNGEDTDERSYEPRISSDGRTVAYWSAAANIVEGDGNKAMDIFAVDLSARDTFLVSQTSSGEQLKAYSYGPAISGNGRAVSFYTHGRAVPDDDNGHRADVYVWELEKSARASD